MACLDVLYSRRRQEKELLTRRMYLEMHLEYALYDEHSRKQIDIERRIKNLDRRLSMVQSEIYRLEFEEQKVIKG